MANAYIDILTNHHNNVLYVGSSIDLKKRIYLHRNGLIPGFTKKYNVSKLVYFEASPDETSARAREKQIKGGSRAKKMALVIAKNSGWQDLFATLE